MAEVSQLGTIVLAAAGVLFLALGASKLTEWLPVPAPALFLLGAAGASELFPSLRDHLPILAVQRIGIVALIAILFDGGMHVGWRRFRRSWAPIATLGVLGTFATAGLVTLLAHYAFDFGWTAAGLLGAALAPTDPAVMFSVLGNREVGGRSGTILEGESGANDPVGIALVIGLLELAREHGSFWIVVREFSVEMAVGLAVGLAGGRVLILLMQNVSLPRAGLYPLRTLTFAGIVYGVATVAHGSGFLAVFVAGLLVGDVRAPYKAEIERFHGALATLAEIVVFVALGVTIDLGDLGRGHLWLDGLALAAFLAVVARPVVALPLLLPARIRMRERLFVAWGGLKGAVPILLAAFVVVAGASDARRIYDVVFVVVALSVLVEGTSITFAARLAGVPMHVSEPEPFDLGLRLRSEPSEVHRFEVARGARGVGHPIRDLPLGESAWISFVIRDGEPIGPRGSMVIEPGDEVVVLAKEQHAGALRRLFQDRTA